MTQAAQRAGRQEADDVGSEPASWSRSKSLHWSSAVGEPATDATGRRPGQSVGALYELVHVDERDRGCDATTRRLAGYAELLLRDSDPAQLLPSVAAHLRACRACRDDLDRLVELIQTL